MVNAERVVQIEDGIEWKELKKGHNKGVGFVYQQSYHQNATMWSE